MADSPQFISHQVESVMKHASLSCCEKIAQLAQLNLNSQLVARTHLRCVGGTFFATSQETHIIVAHDQIDVACMAKTTYGCEPPVKPHDELTLGRVTFFQLSKALLDVFSAESIFSKGKSKQAQNVSTLKVIQGIDASGLQLLFFLVW